jgi:hypothetical protein
LLTQRRPTKLHGAQVLPPLPHARSSVPGVQLLKTMSQQPMLQLAGPQPLELPPPAPPPVPPPPPAPPMPQTPALQTFGAAHVVQLAPMRPHWLVVGGSTQMLPLQQPAQFPGAQLVA